jgi:hypothetical protein
VKRWRNLIFVVAVLGLLTVAPFAAAGGDPEPMVIDFNEFIPAEFQDQFEDINGDGIPDFKDGPVEGPTGVAGIWDDAFGEVDDTTWTTIEDDLAAAGKGSSLTGPCKGVAISYDANGMSVDAIIDTGGPGPLIDIYGNQTMTRGDPMKVDTGGVLLYFGSSVPATFHNHRWFLQAAGIFKDDGGDPNPRDKNRNAGSVDFGELLPFEFSALVYANGAWVDEWGPAELPEMDSYPEPNCVGHGWVQFVSDAPLFTGPGLVSLMLAALGFTGVLFNARPALSWRE